MTPLYHRVMQHESYDEDTRKLMHVVWDPTPWMIDVYTGSSVTEEGMAQQYRMANFCEKKFGKESWPMHKRPGRWMFGSASVDGWTWIGFDTQEAMLLFRTEFPSCVKDIA